MEGKQRCVGQFQQAEGVGCVVGEPWGLDEPPWEGDQIDPELPAGRITQSHLQSPKRREPFSAKRRRAPRLARCGNKNGQAPPTTAKLLAFDPNARATHNGLPPRRDHYATQPDNKAATTYRRNTEDTARTLHDRICLEVEVGGRQKHAL